jgi:hypothetical protein
MNPPPVLTFRTGLTDSLIWYPEHNMGYYPVTDSPYDQGYWDKYVAMANTKMGKEITERRIQWVDKWASGAEVVDIGIGCGHFITTRNAGGGKTLGYDINPVGLKWLQDNELLSDPHINETEAISLWDVIEHIHDPTELLANVNRYVFATIPVFAGPEHVLTSKHFRRDEHCWYWTTESFPAFMDWFGFSLLGISDFEVELGREDVATFAFERK